MNEFAQVHARLAVGREAHHFPFIAIFLKAEKLRKFRVEEAEGVGPRNREDMVQAAIGAMPDGSCFPCAAAVHDENSGVIKSGIGVGAESVGEEVINEADARPGRAELLREAFGTAVLVPYSANIARGIEQIEAGERHAASRVAFQVMHLERPGRLPAEANFVEGVWLHFGKIQAGANGMMRKVRIVFASADA